MDKVINIRTRSRTEFVDITAAVEELVVASGVQQGVCCLFVPHTTAAITINEGADPAVIQDIQGNLNKIVPWQGDYAHREGNSAAHIKSSLLGVDKVIFIAGGKLVLGTWQAIYFCEFDGPRNRRVLVKIIPEAA